MKKKGAFGRLLAIKGAGSVLTAFIGLIVIYVAFGIMNPKVFSIMNIQNLLRSMSKYLLIGIGQSFVMITGNIDLSIGSVVGMIHRHAGHHVRGARHRLHRQRQPQHR